MNRRSSATAVVVQTKKKSTLGNYQKWDQKVLFNKIEESPAHFVARVIEGGEEPLVGVTSDAFKGGYIEMRVKFRNEHQSQKDVRLSLTNSGMRSAFKRHISDVKGPAPTAKQHHFERGELVELHACLVDQEMTTLFPYRHRVIAKAERANSVLPLHEIPAALIASRQTDPHHADRLYSYTVVMAAKGEARPITDILAESTALAEHLEPENTLVRGFLLRGRPAPDADTMTGVACLRTKRDDAHNFSSREVLMNFMKLKSHLFLNSMSEEQPWEVIPLYALEPVKVITDQIDALANRYPFLVSQDATPSSMSFAHMNAVIDFKPSDGQPKLLHVGLCRAKPLVVDTSIPDKARERNLKFRNQSELAETA